MAAVNVHHRLMHNALIAAMAAGVGGIAEALPVATRRIRQALRITLPTGSVQHYRAPDADRIAAAQDKRARKAAKRLREAGQ